MFRNGRKKRAAKNNAGEDNCNSAQNVFTLDTKETNFESPTKNEAKNEENQNSKEKIEFPIKFKAVDGSDGMKKTTNESINKEEPSRVFRDMKPITFDSNFENQFAKIRFDDTESNFSRETKSFSTYKLEAHETKVKQKTDLGISLDTLGGGLPSFAMYDALAYQSEKSNELPKPPRRSIPAKLRPAFMYVLNHDKFEDPRHNREGSDKDVKTIKEVLQKKLQLKMEYCPNYTLEEIAKLGEKLRYNDFSQYSAVVIIILSHGHRNDVIQAYDGAYNFYDDILKPMLHNDSLEGKPKLFFIQACKGGDKVKLQSDANGEIQPATDIFKFCSTFEGFLSYRHEIIGTVFIQSLCKQLKESGTTKDIRQIADEVIEDVRELKLGQVPTITYTLTKPYKFGDYIDQNNAVEPAQ